MDDRGVSILAQDFPAAPPRQAQFARHYLLHAARGRLSLTAAGRRWTLPPGRAALIRAGETVGVAALTGVAALSALWPDGLGPRPAAALAVFDLPPAAQALMRWLGQRPPASATDDFDEAAGRLDVARALAVIAVDQARRPLPFDLPVPRDPRLARAMARMEAALDAPLSLPALAAAVAMHPRSLARLFAAETGTGWRTILTRMRLLHAAGLLSTTTLPVNAVALEVGYASASAFAAAFRGFAGCGPAAFRARSPRG